MNGVTPPDFPVSSYDPVQFGQRIRKLRLAEKLTRDALAQAAGLTERTVRNIEHGRSSHEASRLRIAQALGVSYASLTVGATSSDPAAGTPDQAASGRAAVNAVGQAERKPRQTLRNLALALLPLSAALAILFLVVKQTGRAPEFRLDDRHLSAVDPQTGRLLWELRGVLGYRVTPWSRGRQIAVRRRATITTAGLEFYDARSGELRRVLGPSLDEYRDSFADSLLEVGGIYCHDFDFVDITGDGAQELLALFRHSVYRPSSVEVYDRQGNSLISYHLPGHANSARVLDVDADARSELLVAGTDNQGGGCTLLVLDAHSGRGAAASLTAEASVPRPDTARIRLVFPPFAAELMSALSALRLETYEISTFDGPRHVFGLRVSLGTQNGIVNCILDSKLRPVDLIITDSFRAVLGRAVNEGRVEARFLEREYWNSWLSSHQRFERGRRETTLPSQHSLGFPAPTRFRAGAGASACQWR